MRDNNYQYDLVKKNRVARIKEHIVYYINNPKEAIKFYYRKYNIQWNDPSFSGLINIEWTSRHREATATSDFLIYGKGRKVLSEILNICHFIVFLLATVGMFKFIKKWSIEGALILMIIIGGILFHELLWEVKGRYALFYYVLLIPFSVIGFSTYFNSKRLVKKIKYIIR